jgi:hypothetical protein
MFFLRKIVIETKDLQPKEELWTQYLPEWVIAPT